MSESPATPLERAADLTRRGFAVIPVPHMAKGPVVRGWQRLRLTAADLPQHFNGTPVNIGMLCGEPSGWVVDIDLDHPRAVERADEYLPPTGAKFGRASKPRSHRLYRLTAPTKTKKWTTATGAMIVELRSSGCQTIAPGSTHPSGENVAWDNDGEPAEISAADLIAACNRLASAVKEELGERMPVVVKPVPPRAPRDNKNESGHTALQREAAEIAATPAGGRNDALYRAARRMGLVVGGGDVDRTAVEETFLAAARTAGLPDDEAQRTIASGVDAGEAEAREGRPSQSELLVRLALERYRLGRSESGEPFAVEKDGPNVALMLRGHSDALRGVLAREYRRRFGGTPGAAALADALTVLTGEAQDAAPEPVALRVAAHEGGVVYDLGDPEGRAVVIRAGAWEVVARSPVLFRRTALTAAVPVPERGGDLADLRALMNVTAETWPVLRGWLVAAMMPDISHPILLLGGEQGTGKSTNARVLVQLFDPSPAPLRTEPRDQEAWALAASGSWGVCVDNISYIADWFSDALCKAVTGDGLVRRQLYSDSGLTVLAFRRVVMLTSIDAGALRGDLGDRLVLVDLERIPDDRRRSERELLEAYAQARPRLFGALLDLLAGVLTRLPDVRLESMPRMADFARVLAALDSADGADAPCLTFYLGQKERIDADVIESDPVATALIAVVGVGGWTGTASELHRHLTPEHPPRGWPRNGAAMSARIRRLMPALRGVGIEVERDRAPSRDRSRRYTIRRVLQNAVQAVHTSDTPENTGDSARTLADASLDPRPPRGRSPSDEPPDGAAHPVAAPGDDDTWSP